METAGEEEEEAITIAVDTDTIKIEDMEDHHKDTHRKATHHKDIHHKGTPHNKVMDRKHVWRARLSRLQETD